LNQLIASDDDSDDTVASIPLRLRGPSRPTVHPTHLQQQRIVNSVWESRKKSPKKRKWRVETPEDKEDEDEVEEVFECHCCTYFFGNHDMKNCYNPKCAFRMCKKCHARHFNASDKLCPQNCPRRR